MSVHKKTVSRIGALLLALVMMLSLLPTSVLATSSEPTVVIAGSDFQNKSGDKEPTWYFNINGYSGGTIFFKTPDALLECFAGAITKIDAIK